MEKVPLTALGVIFQRQGTKEGSWVVIRITEDKSDKSRGYAIVCPVLGNPKDDATRQVSYDIRDTLPNGEYGQYIDKIHSWNELSNAIERYTRAHPIPEPNDGTLQALRQIEINGIQRFWEMNPPSQE